MPSSQATTAVLVCPAAAGDQRSGAQNAADHDHRHDVAIVDQRRLQPPRPPVNKPGDEPYCDDDQQGPVAVRLQPGPPPDVAVIGPLRVVCADPGPPGQVPDDDRTETAGSTHAARRFTSTLPSRIAITALHLRACPPRTDPALLSRGAPNLLVRVVLRPTLPCGKSFVQTGGHGPVTPASAAEQARDPEVAESCDGTALNADGSTIFPWHPGHWGM